MIMTYPKVDSETSEKFWLLKAFAIIAVVACHCTNTIDNPGRINTIATYFFDAWKGSGVPISLRVAVNFCHLLRIKWFLLCCHGYLQEP